MQHNPDNNRQAKLDQALQKLISSYIVQESNRISLITVTRCRTAPDQSRAEVYISVLPTEKERPAIQFLKRQAINIREHIKKPADYAGFPIWSLLLIRAKRTVSVFLISVGKSSSRNRADVV